MAVLTFCYTPKLFAKIIGQITSVFGVQHSNFLEIGTKIEIHNNGLLREGKI